MHVDASGQRERGLRGDVELLDEGGGERHPLGVLLRLEVGPQEVQELYEGLLALNLVCVAKSTFLLFDKVY
jgi:hypothetical protein